MQRQRHTRQNTQDVPKKFTTESLAFRYCCLHSGLLRAFRSCCLHSGLVRIHCGGFLLLCIQVLLRCVSFNTSNDSNFVFGNFSNVLDQQYQNMSKKCYIKIATASVQAWMRSKTYQWQRYTKSCVPGRVSMLTHVCKHNIIIWLQRLHRKWENYEGGW